MTIENTFEYKNKNASCKTCRSKNVYWKKFFNDKGFESFQLNDIATNEPHRFTCSPNTEGIRIPIKQRDKEA